MCHSFSMQTAIDFLYFIIALIVTITIHEASHALVAYYLGDPTAKIRGRLTLNPLAHLDLIGSIIFLVTRMIGWAKPVPVNPANFKHPMRDSALTALAGPISNFVLSFVVALPLKYIGGNPELARFMPEAISEILWTIFHVSIFLGIFNLFPFPPLDGSKVLGLFVPASLRQIYANYLENGVKYFIVIILVDAIIIRDFFDFSIFGYVMMFLHEKVSLVLLLGT